ncbi:MAG TPA: hypothetical protein VM900_04025 [Sphingomonas sp.]|nr:hypothetical protein [Sphingomonas sp.]
MTGFLSADQIDELRAGLVQAIASLNCPRGTHRSIFDIRACKIQSQDIVQALRGMSETRGAVAQRLAIVVGESLMRMQLRRIVSDKRLARTFDDVRSAEAWVLEPVRVAA